MANVAAASSIKEDGVVENAPAGVERHISGQPVAEAPRLCAVGILIPAGEGVACSGGVSGLGDRRVLLPTACGSAGQCTAVGVEGDRAIGSFLPLGIQGAVLRFVISGCAVAITIDILLAACLRIIPAAENIPQTLRHRQVIEGLIIGSCDRRWRYSAAAVGIEGHGVLIGCPHGVEGDGCVFLVDRAEVIDFFTAVNGGPAGLGIAGAVEEFIGKGEVKVFNFDGCRRRSRAVCAGIVGDSVGVGFRHGQGDVFEFAGEVGHFVAVVLLVIDIKGSIACGKAGGDGDGDRAACFGKGGAAAVISGVADRILKQDGDIFVGAGLCAGVGDLNIAAVIGGGNAGGGHRKAAAGAVQKGQLPVAAGVIRELGQAAGGLATHSCGDKEDIISCGRKVHRGTNRRRVTTPITHQAGIFANHKR